ncbi:MAG TPA: disulfide bond formation protein B [Pseudomonadales bacterium]
MTQPLSWALLALALAGAMVGGAQFLEHIVRLDPCPLCLMQRLWVMLAGVVIIAGVGHNRRLRSYPVVAMICCVVGAGFSLRQLWLQQLPADRIPACGPDMAYMIESFPLSDILKAMTLGTGNCAEVSWTLLGISIAGWSLAGFVALGVAIGLWFVAAHKSETPRS